MLKSVREAGENTRWVFGDAGYEARLAALRRAGAGPRRRASSRSFRAFEATVAADGAANGLIQAALKLTMPGVPDIYRGAEVWEQSLVDPDNRRPVDFAARAAMLARARPATLCGRADGEARADARRLLARGGRGRQLFAEGSYEPLREVRGRPRSAPSRARHGDAVLVVAAALRHGADADAEARDPPAAGGCGAVARRADRGGASPSSRRPGSSRRCRWRCLCRRMRPICTGDWWKAIRQR